MNRPLPHHPFQLAIEQAWDAGHTPRLLVHGDTKGVVLPRDVLERFDGAPIALELLPSYPLHPTFEVRGMLVDLAFSGTIFRASIPWEAVTAVTTLETGVGYVRILSSRPVAPAPPKAGPRPTVENQTAPSETENATPALGQLIVGKFGGKKT